MSVIRSAQTPTTQSICWCVCFLLQCYYYSNFSIDVETMNFLSILRFRFSWAKFSHRKRIVCELYLFIMAIAWNFCGFMCLEMRPAIRIARLLLLTDVRGYGIQQILSAIKTDYLAYSFIFLWKLCDLFSALRLKFVIFLCSQWQPLKLLCNFNYKHSFLIYMKANSLFSSMNCSNGIICCRWYILLLEFNCQKPVRKK